MKNFKTLLIASTLLLSSSLSFGMLRLEQAQVFRFEDKVESVAFHPELDWIAAVGGEKTVKMWDLDSTGEPAFSLADPTSEIPTPSSPFFWKKCIAASWNHDGTYLATGYYTSEDRAGSVKIIDFSSSPEEITEIDPGSGCCAVSWHPSRNLLAIGAKHEAKEAAEAGTHLKIWDNDAQTYAFVMSPDRDMADDIETRSCDYLYKINCLDWSSNGRFIATGESPEGTVKIWDTVVKKCVAELNGDKQDTLAVAWKPDCYTLAIAGLHGTIKICILTLEDGQCTSDTDCILFNPELRFQALAWSPNGRYLAIGATDNEMMGHGYLKIWDSVERAFVELNINDRVVGPTYSLIRSDYSEAKKEINAVSWSADGRFLSVGGEDGLVRVFEVSTE